MLSIDNVNIVLEKSSFLLRTVHNYDRYTLWKSNLCLFRTLPEVGPAVVWTDRETLDISFLGAIRSIHYIVKYAAA